MAAAWRHNDPRYAPLLLKGLGPDARTQSLSARDAEGRSALYFALHKGHAKVRACVRFCVRLSLWLCMKWG
jgi:hypothetical protein